MYTCVYIYIYICIYPYTGKLTPAEPTTTMSESLQQYITTTNVIVSLVIFFVVRVIFWLFQPVIQSYHRKMAADDPSEDRFIDPKNNGVDFKTNNRNLFPSLFDEGSIYLSLIVPAYNEYVRLPPMMDATMDYLEKRRKRDSNFTYEVIIVDDGSRDTTVKVALEYSRKYSTDHVRVLKLFENNGKGGAVRKGMLRARGEYLLMVDADGATSISDIERLEDHMSKIEKDGLGMVVGSRHHLMDEAVAERSQLRNFLMFGFHFYVSIMCAAGINDTQCGFKLFSRQAARNIFPSQHIERWAFDVELLYLANTLGIPIGEVAVNWQEIDGSKVNLFESIPQMARDIFTIRACYVLGIWKVKNYESVTKEKSS